MLFFKSIFPKFPLRPKNCALPIMPITHTFLQEIIISTFIYTNLHILGVYTLIAALAGRQVIAVDANIENLRRLAKSLSIGGFFSRVTLVHNAVHASAFLSMPSLFFHTLCTHIPSSFCYDIQSIFNNLRTSKPAECRTPYPVS